jgi:ferredoxin
VIGGELHEIVLLPDETIFAGAHRLGLAPPFSCIAGYCGACTASLEEGEVEMRINRALGPKQLARGLILACQAVPRPGTCRVRFIEGPGG